MRVRLNVNSQLRSLATDINKLQEEAVPEALARGVGQTLELARDDLQKGLNNAIEGGPANKFISELAVGWNVGRSGKVNTSRRTTLPTAKDIVSTYSGRVFIQDKQEEILDNALSSATASSIKHGGNKSTEPFTVNPKLRTLFLRGGSGGRELILKKNNKGNIVRFKRGALGKLKDAAREQVKGNRPPRKGQGPFSRFKESSDAAKYFEIKRRQTGPTGFKFFPGIYRREDNKKEGEKRRTKLFQVIAYQDSLTYEKLGKKFNFEKNAVTSLNKNFTTQMDSAIASQFNRTFR